MYTLVKHSQAVRRVYTYVVHFAIVEQHAVHFLYRSLCSLVGLKVHEAITLRAVFITNHLQETQTVIDTLHNARCWHYLNTHTQR